MNLQEATIFETGSLDKSGVDLETAPDITDLGGDRLGDAKSDRTIGLAGLSESETVRHYTRLSSQNYCVDSVFYPLGSCTMKYNPRFNEKAASLQGFTETHPYQPESTVQGCLEVMYRLGELLKNLTGMADVALSPAAGAHGELCGIMTIRAALEATGDARKIVLVPTSAHGTNPATAAICGYQIEQVPTTADGRVDIAYLQERLAGEKGKDVAAFMLTNPNTCGLFEKDILQISKLVHKAGTFFYMDGANFNALMGIVAPKDLGVDAMHINVHKTFSAPHGGGGPGAGPVVFCKELAPYMPLPKVVFEDGEYRLIEKSSKSFGKMKEFNGNFGILLRSFAYILGMGSAGLKQAAEEAVLNANYIRANLQDTLHLPFAGTCMHEVLFDEKTLAEVGLTTTDLAKNLIDFGFHPMTIYFPLVVHGAILIEPTETESKDTLDKFIAAIKSVLAQAKEENGLQNLKQAPHTTVCRRPDETKAARQPKLKA